MKEGLLYQGWIESQTVELGQTRKVLLRLTKRAKEALGLDSEIPEYGSLVHEYWKRFYGRKFEQQGYEVDFEVPRKSGRVDVVACKKNERIAIEIETGKSNIVQNVKQDLIAKFDKVLVVATDKKAFEKVERELGRASLIISEKVEIVLAVVFPV